MNRPVRFKKKLYNPDGETLWQLQQFNPGGISALRKGLTVRLDYPQYNTRGSLLNEVADVNSDMVVDMGYQYVYDGRNRLREVYAGLTDIKTQNDLMARYSYNDALGLVTKTTYHRDCNVGVGSSFRADSITYSYDVRDRLKEINSNLFNYKLFYDRDIPLYYDCPMSADTNFNGNINGTIATWKLKNSNKDPGNFGQPTYYGYRYDGLNRLIAADGILGDLTQPASFPHCQPVNTIGDEIMTYDRIGNILSLQRYLPPASGTNPVAEARKYSYQAGTSRLKQIKNVGTFGQWQYNYDPAGNTIRDEYRTVLDIEYGRANLPFTMKVQNDKRENYLYDAQDMRIYKEMVPLPGQFVTVENPEFYLRDVAGNEIGILDIAKANWTWYGFGRERFARLLPSGNQQPQFFAKDNGFGSDNSGSLETKLRNELRDHVQQGRTFPEKLIEADIRQKPTDPAVRMIVTETKLKEMQNNKPSLKADIIQEANIEHEKQQLLIKESDGTQKRMSAEELIKQAGDATLALKIEPDLQAFAATGNSNFVMPPYKYNSNKVLGTVSFFIFDHLGSSRVVYKPNVNCNGGGVSYSLESVIDLYPYGHQLRTYVSGVQDKYIFTGKERDKETGLDYHGARFRDSDAIPFTTIDPRTPEFPAWSPYNYGLCNPVRFIDLTGKGPDDFYFNQKGELVRQDKNDQPDRFFVQTGTTLEKTTSQDATPTGTGSAQPTTFNEVPQYLQIGLNTDLGQMARAIFAEAAGQSAESKLAVAEVIRNRANDNTAPSAANAYSAQFSNVNTYGEVVNQAGQFQSVQSGAARYSNPFSVTKGNITEQNAFAGSFSAAIKAHYQNTNTANGAVFFYSPYISAPKWTSALRQVTVTGSSSNDFRFYKFK